MSISNELKKSVFTKSEIERKVRELIVDIHHLSVKPEELSDEMSQLDSIQSIELVIMLERTFDIMFDDNELIATNYETISNIVENVVKKLEEDENE